MTGTGRTVGIVGLGLIGGSLAQDLVARGVHVVATTRSHATRVDAADAGITVVDAVADVVGEADLVVVAVALDALPETLAAVAAALPEGSPHPTITDVGSVKAPPVARAEALFDDPSVFVPGHPMAGTELSGWAAADPRLFAGRRWALGIDAPVALGRWAEVAALALAVGSEVVPVGVVAHDAAVALVSHLPYAVAATAAALLDADPDAALARSLAAGSFADLTRVAGGHPTLGADMARANRTAVAARLGQMGDGLHDLAAQLEDGADGAGAGAVEARFDAGRAGRAALDAAGAAATEPRLVRLDREGLRALGERGGRVTAVGSAAPDAEVIEVTVVEPVPEP